MLGAPEPNAVLQLGSHKSGVEGENHLLVTLLLMQPRIRLAFWPAGVHCRVTLSFSSANTPKSFSAGLLSVHSLPSLYLCLGFVLVSAGTELIVFLAAGTVLCFEFSMRRMLITLMFSVVAQ